jgi:hypothetical protein
VGTGRVDRPAPASPCDHRAGDDHGARPLTRTDLIDAAATNRRPPDAALACYILKINPAVVLKERGTMSNYSDWINGLSYALRDWLERAIDYLPYLLGGILILVFGWVVARLLSGGAVRLAHLLEQTALRLANRPLPEAGDAPPPWTRVLGSIVFWVVILFFLTLATQLLGLETFSSWLHRVAAYLPTLFVGALIILAGFLISAIMRDVVIATAPLPEQQRMLIGRIVQFVILIIAFVIGADQIGINVTFLVILAAVVLGTFLGGVALTVSLGARTFVANLISAQSVRTQYQVGQVIRIAIYEGRILALTPTAVVLETTEGRVTLPAKFFSEEPVTVLMGRDDNG